MSVTMSSKEKEKYKRHKSERKAKEENKVKPARVASWFVSPVWNRRSIL